VEGAGAQGAGSTAGGGAGAASATGIFAPQAPQNKAVSYKGEPQLPQNFAITFSVLDRLFWIVRQCIASFRGWLPPISRHDLYTLETMIATLHTDRLLLRPLQLADAEQTQRLFPHWEVVQFLNSKVPWPYPADGALAFYRDVALPAIERGDAWHWTLRLRTSLEELIGSIGLVREEDYAVRGFWLGLPWQGRGLMTEAVIAVNDYCFDVLGFRGLRAPKAILNVSSRRISEKTGMRVVANEERDYVSGRFMSEVWEITAEEWREKRAAVGNILRIKESS
jgi:[ribosomal protein S5]-alanine N-acetyltransferase